MIRKCSISLCTRKTFECCFNGRHLHPKRNYGVCSLFRTNRQATGVRTSSIEPLSNAIKTLFISNPCIILPGFKGRVSVTETDPNSRKGVNNYSGFSHVETIDKIMSLKAVCSEIGLILYSLHEFNWDLGNSDSVDTHFSSVFQLRLIPSFSCETLINNCRHLLISKVKEILVYAIFVFFSTVCCLEGRKAQIFPWRDTFSHPFKGSANILCCWRYCKLTNPIRSDLFWHFKCPF